MLQSNDFSVCYNTTIQNMFSNSDYSDYLFYACMLSKCTLVLNEDLNAPAGVSYSNCSYKLHINPTKFSTYTLIERLAILKHEMLHILNGHLTLRSERMPNHKTANIAMDCSINQLIDKNHLPKDCITPEYIEKEINQKIKRDEPSEYYYDLLNKKNTIDMLSLRNDNHESWEYSDNEESIESQRKTTSEMIEEAKDDTFRITGTYPNEYSKWLKLNKNKTEHNWKKLLKSSIKSTNRLKTIFRTNRNYPDRPDLKGKKKSKRTEILYIIDASGSVKNSEFKLLNSEIVALCSEMNLKINAIQVDSEASEPEVLTKNTELIERKRNAGTFLSKGLEKAEEHKLKYTTVIVSTDGFLDSSDIDNFKKINKKVIFLISSGGTKTYIKETKNIKVIQMK